MPHLVYWVAPSLTDRPAFSIRERTRRECAAKRKAFGAAGYGKPRKIEVYYTDAFDLARQCLEGLGEGIEE